MNSENSSGAELQEDKKAKDETANMLTARSALLDFYSDRAVAFASFFLASIFGLVTVLAIVQGIEDSVFLISISLFLFWAFAYAGYYTFQRFRFYADIASKLQAGKGGLKKTARLDKLKFAIETGGKKTKTTNLADYLKKKVEEQEQMLGQRFFMRWRDRTIKAFDLLYWFLVWVLGMLVYYPTTKYRVWCMIALSSSLVILLAYEKLKGWKEARKELKWFLRFVFVAMVAMFIIFVISMLGYLP